MTAASPWRPADAGRRLIGAVVLLAAAALIVGGIRTSLAEVTASTSSTGLFSAGSVELEQVGQAVELLFDEELLYPGVTAVACVEIAYRGSVPAEVRVYAQPMGGTGLDEFIEFDIWTSDQPCPAELSTDDRPVDPVFDETLRDFWQRHGEYGSGIALGVLEQNGTTTMLARAELMDANDAAGRYTDFAVVVEARP